MSILTTFKDLLIESLKEHKKMIIILYLIFIIAFCATWILTADSTSSANLPTNTDPTPIGSSAESAIDIFIHNEMGSIIVYLGSIFFGIAAIAATIFNGVNLELIGMVLSQVMPKGGIQYILYLIPHGIFEITATIIGNVAGILLFLFVWRLIKTTIRSDEKGFKQRLSKSYEMHKKVFIQSLVLMIFVTILLLIAAPIEAYVSIPLSEWILGV